MYPYTVNINKLILGKEAILAIANHPTTDINTLDDSEGKTALHMCIEQFKYRGYADGDILLKKIEALLEGGADPTIPNRENITSMQLFRSCRNQRVVLPPVDGEVVGEIYESHYDQIESAVQNAIANI